jgi:hypothetical protein
MALILIVIISYYYITTRTFIILLSTSISTLYSKYLGYLIGEPDLVVAVYLIQHILYITKVNFYKLHCVFVSCK